MLLPFSFSPRTKLTNPCATSAVVKLELERNNAIKAWRSLLGPTNPSVAKAQAPGSIRAQFGNSEDPEVSTQVAHTHTHSLSLALSLTG